MSKYDELIEIVNHDYSYCDELSFVKTSEEEEDIFQPCKFINDLYQDYSFDEDDKSDNESIASDRMITFKVPEYYLYNEEFYQTPPETGSVNPIVLFQDQEDDYVKESAQQLDTSRVKECAEAFDAEKRTDNMIVVSEVSGVRSRSVKNKKAVVRKGGKKEDNKLANDMKIDNSTSDNDDDSDYCFEEEDEDDYDKDPEYKLNIRKGPKGRARGSSTRLSSNNVQTKKNTSRKKRRKGASSTTATKFTCSHCKKIFDRKSNHDSHIRVHLTVRPHKCSLCGRGFARNSDRKRHEKGHISKCVLKCHGKQSGIKWGCGNTFQSRMELKKHWLKKGNQCLNGFSKGFRSNSKNGITKCNDENDDDESINNICVLALLQLERQQRVKRRS